MSLVKIFLWKLCQYFYEVKTLTHLSEAWVTLNCIVCRDGPRSWFYCLFIHLHNSIDNIYPCLKKLKGNQNQIQNAWDAEWRKKVTKKRWRLMKVKERECSPHGRVPWEIGSGQCLSGRDRWRTGRGPCWAGMSVCHVMSCQLYVRYVSDDTKVTMNQLALGPDAGNGKQRQRSGTQEDLEETVMMWWADIVLILYFKRLICTRNKIDNLNRYKIVN